MGAAAAALQVAGGAISILGTLQQGQAAYAAAKYNADIAKRNAVLAIDQSQSDAATQNRESREIIGSMEANFGASGVTTEGSVNDVINFNATKAELDRQNILYKGQLQAMGFREEAALEKARGRQAITQSRFQAASQFLTTAGSAASSLGTPAPKASK